MYCGYLLLCAFGCENYEAPVHLPKTTDHNHHLGCLGDPRFTWLLPAPVALRRRPISSIYFVPREWSVCWHLARCHHVDWYKRHCSFACVCSFNITDITNPGTRDLSGQVCCMYTCMVHACLCSVSNVSAEACLALTPSMQSFT